MRALADYRPSIQASYRFIDRFIRANGFGPSIREIMDGCNLSSTSVATYHRDELTKGGWITFTGRDRSIALTGAITLTFYGLDAEYIRETFGEQPELAVINWLRQPSADVPAFMS